MRELGTASCRPQQPRQARTLVDQVRDHSRGRPMDGTGKAGGSSTTCQRSRHGGPRHPMRTRNRLGGTGRHSRRTATECTDRQTPVRARHVRQGSRPCSRQVTARATTLALTLAKHSGSPQGDRQVLAQSRKRAVHGCRPRDEHIVVTRLGGLRQDFRRQGTQAPLRPVSRDGSTDLLAGGQADAYRRIRLRCGWLRAFRFERCRCCLSGVARLGVDVGVVGCPPGIVSRHGEFAFPHLKDQPRRRRPAPASGHLQELCPAL